MADPDPQLDDVFATMREADPSGQILGRVFRSAFDFLYDGQRTGRYSPKQLSKTEKAHCGSVVEINMRRSLDAVISDGTLLDFRIAGHEVDCKFSLSRGGWMLPPECFGELLIVCHASDEEGTWSVGMVRAVDSHLNAGRNRDGKTTLNATGRDAIRWLFLNAELPPNALLHQPPEKLNTIFTPRSGQRRVDALFREVQLTPISRSVVATVAQQDDYMKRVRYNGGSRTNLQPEGILIAGGDYEVHRSIALQLGAPDVLPGEFVSFTVVPAAASEHGVTIEGSKWRIASAGETPTVAAPLLPSVRRGT
jgi:hypothetical protein